MKSATVISLAVLGIAIGLSWRSPAARSQDQETVSNENIHALLMERQAILEEIVKDVTLMHQTGSRKVEGVLDVMDDLVRTRLELADSRSRRIEVWTGHLQQLQQLLESAQKNFAQGNAVRSEPLRVNAEMLQAQIELERVKNG